MATANSLTAMTDREILVFDLEAINALKSAQEPKDVLAAIQRLQPEGIVHSAASLTLQSTLEETRDAVLTLIEAGFQQKIAEHGLGASEECGFLIEFLDSLQGRLNNASELSELTSFAQEFPDELSQGEGYELRRMLYKLFKGISGIPDDWKVRLQEKIDVLHNKLTKEKASYQPQS